MEMLSKEQSYGHHSHGSNFQVAQQSDHNLQSSMKKDRIQLKLLTFNRDGDVRVEIVLRIFDAYPTNLDREIA